MADPNVSIRLCLQVRYNYLLFSILLTSSIDTTPKPSQLGLGELWRHNFGKRFSIIPYNLVFKRILRFRRMFAVGFWAGF